ncbi:unnamed protein product [Polarella glacialis]|uniref:Lipid desaturase domain-containing protein n=1 Tax=Polarella glacialis TaxID=89957 RepID=A0A813I1I7_POLGL|nr:unnamed protein product [Polarella glacialis]CAE8643844.1 unnamed protein product [Polarella glacialis]
MIPNLGALIPRLPSNTWQPKRPVSCRDFVGAAAAEGQPLVSGFKEVGRLHSQRASPRPLANLAAFGLTALGLRRLQGTAEGKSKLFWQAGCGQLCRSQVSRGSAQRAIPIRRRTSESSEEEGAAYFKPLVEGDLLRASPPQRVLVAAMIALLAAGLIRVGGLLSAAAAAGGGAVEMSVACALAVLLGAEFADFGTGVYHFSVDNYGSASTPVVGSQIEAFQGHHEEPWTITHRDFCNNCFPTCLATMPFLAAFEMLASSPYLLLWAVTACAGIAFCQELHKWSHTLRSQCHPVINWLQDRRVLVARKVHLRHHKRPFETNYCIVTGHMNPILDKSGFFRVLAALIAQLTGVRPRCETGSRFEYLVERRVG